MECTISQWCDADRDRIRNGWDEPLKLTPPSLPLYIKNRERHEQQLTNKQRMAWTRGRAKERVVRVVPMTTCPCQVHCGTLTVSVYPLDRRSDAGRGEGVTISLPCGKFWTKNEPWTTISQSSSWSPPLLSLIVTTIAPECWSNPATCPTTSKRNVDDPDCWWSATENAEAGKWILSSEHQRQSEDQRVLFYAENRELKAYVNHLFQMTGE